MLETYTASYIYKRIVPVIFSSLGTKDQLKLVYSLKALSIFNMSWSFRTVQDCVHSTTQNTLVSSNDCRP